MAHSLFTWKYSQMDFGSKLDLEFRTLLGVYLWLQWLQWLHTSQPTKILACRWNYIVLLNWCTIVTLLRNDDFVDDRWWWSNWPWLCLGSSQSINQCQSSLFYDRLGWSCQTFLRFCRLILLSIDDSCGISLGF